MKRKYTIKRFYSITCSECNEDIAEHYPDTKAEAIAQRDNHEAWHKREDGE